MTKANLVLRLNKELIRKWRSRKLNFSKFMEYCLETLEGKEIYLVIPKLNNRRIKNDIKTRNF